MIANLCILASVSLGVLGQFLIKRGLNSLGKLDFAAGLVVAYLKVFLSPLVVLGLGVYFLGVFFWLYALSKVDLSYAYPFVSLSYVLVILASVFLLGEQVTPLRWLGVAAICAGVVLVARS